MVVIQVTGAGEGDEEEADGICSVWRETDCFLSKHGGEVWRGAQQEEEEEEEEVLRRGGGGGSEGVGGEVACRTVCVRAYWARNNAPALESRFLCCEEEWLCWEPGGADW